MPSINTPERLLVQCELRHTNEIMITWLDTKKAIHAGDRISLKDQDDGRLWTVESISQPELARHIHHEWSNNI